MIRKRDLEAEKFAARLLLLLMNEMRASGRRQVGVFVYQDGPVHGDSPGAAHWFTAGGGGDPAMWW